MILNIVIGAVVGGVLGLGYYQLVGCPTGACPLTRHPWVTTLYGVALGALVGSNLH